MDIYAVREKLRKGVPIGEIPLRVTYYTRVSTDSDAQLNSLENQTRYYDDLIRTNPKWTYVDGYIEEGLTGVTTKKRERFNDMIDDALDGKFDFIITKEVSRFARNTMDSLGYTRNLLNKGIGVFFQEQNINTLSEEGELRLTIMAALAQEESQRLSQRVKFGHAQSIKKNVVYGNSLIYGYKKDNKKLVIDETQAPMIVEIFDLYSTDQYSLKQLSRVLFEKGYKNKNGKLISHNTLSGIIANPKYKGYYCGNKVKIIDLFTKKQKFLPESEWRMFKDETGEYVPAIVDESVWDRANEILKRRSKDVIGHKNQHNTTNLYTGKIYCKHCDAHFYRKASSSKSFEDKIWVCSGKIKNHTDSCPTFAIYESELNEIIVKMVSVDIKEIEEKIRKYEDAFKNLSLERDNTKQFESIKSQIEIVNKKINKALELNINGKISDDAFSRLSADCDKELAELQTSYVQLEREHRALASMGDEINSFRSLMLQARSEALDGMIHRAFVNKFINKIYVEMNDGIMQVDVVFGTINAKIHAEYQRRPGFMVKNVTPGRRSKFIRSLRSASNHKETREYDVRIAMY